MRRSSTDITVKAGRTLNVCTVCDSITLRFCPAPLRADPEESRTDIESESWASEREERLGLNICSYRGKIAELKDEVERCECELQKAEQEFLKLRSERVAGGLTEEP
jgi:hypothetical protein